MEKNKNTFKPIGVPADLHQQIKEIAVDKQAKIYEIIKELLKHYKNNNLK